MKTKLFLHLLALGAALLLTLAGARADNILITSNSVWRYLDNGTDQSAAWREAWDENDPVWSAGAAPLGFGLSGIATTQAMAHVTYYHRRVFTVADPAAYSNLVVRLRRDDGGIVYLNGVEVFRSNMPTGAVDYLTLATISTTGPNQFNFFSNNVSPSLLVAGTNRLAVEIHQAGTNSVDAAFNLELRGQLRSASPPVITQQPTSQSVVENRPVTFTIVAEGGELSYQWQRNGFALPGATNATLTLNLVSLADNGSAFRVIVQNSSGSVTSTVASLTVSADIVAPHLVSAAGDPSLMKITVRFDELMDKDVVEDRFNWDISGFGFPATATLNPDGRSVDLGTSLQTQGTLYAVTVGDVSDLAGNLIAPNPASASFRSFVVTSSPCLVAWWPMQGSVTDIVGANQPSATAGISFVPGKIGQGALVGTGGYIEIPDAVALHNPLFTLEAWVRPDGIGPNDDTVGSSMIQKVRDGGFSYSLYWRKDGKFTFLTGPTANGFIVSTHNFPSGCFYHVVGIYDGAEFRLYVNGVLEAQRASSAPLDYSGGNPWTIGASPEPFRTLGYARTWNGVIDEVKIWCRALSAPEILATYVAGGPDVRCGCVEPPMITCLPDFGVLCGTPWNFNTPTAHDVCCDTNATVTILKTETNGTCPMFITRTWVATDCHGNTNTCSQTVAVIDNTPPIFGSATPSPNLVPNPGFENHTACPSTFNSEIVFAPPWIAPTAGSSDYYHTCGTYPVSVPVNRAGNQTPYDGDAYAGLHAHNTDLSPQLTPYREYIETPLSQPLQPGRTYSVSFYVSLSDTATRAVDNLGAHLSVNQVTSGTHGPLLLTPQVRNPAGNFLTDKIGWTLIQGTFTAAGGEQFLTIGNFYSDAQTSTQPVSGGTDGWAYYYIDGVTVRDTTPTCLTNKTVECGSAWAFDEPTAYDECCGSAATITVLKTESSGFCPRYFTRTWQATDCCSNTATCIQVVTVVDTTPPFFACDLPQVNLVQNGSFEAGVPVFNPAIQLRQLLVSAPDVSGWAIVETGAAFYWANGAHAASAGTAFGPASDGNLYLYFNGSSDNSSLRGKIATSVNFPSSGTYRLEYDLWSEPSINGSRDAGFTVDLTGLASYSFTDLFTPPFSLNGTPPSVTAANWRHVIHDFAVTTPGVYALSFTDASVYGNPNLPNAGNTPSPLLDNVSITAKCCDTTRIVECGTPWHFDPPAAFDTCCDTNVTLTGIVSSTGNACSNVNTIIWKATDWCSNSVTCTQTVIVVDTTRPVLRCPEVVKVTTCSNSVPVYYRVLATDTCDANVQVVCTPPSPGPFNLGTTLVNCTATDACGNVATCRFPVVVFSGANFWQSFPAGLRDCYANEFESAYPGACLKAAYPNALWKYFDDSTVNRFFGHTWNLPPGTYTDGYLVTQMKDYNCRDSSFNDTIGLGLQNCATPVWAWSRALNLLGADLSLPISTSPWCNISNWGPLLKFHLTDLPPLGNNHSVLGDINATHRLDMLVQDDTRVDFARLRLRRCAPGQIVGGLEATLANAVIAHGSNSWTLMPDPQLGSPTNYSASLSLGFGDSAALHVNLSHLTNNSNGVVSVQLVSEMPTGGAHTFGWRFGIPVEGRDGVVEGRDGVLFTPVASSANGGSTLTLRNHGMTVLAQTFGPGGIPPAMVIDPIPFDELTLNFTAGTNSTLRFVSPTMVSGPFGTVQADEIAFTVSDSSTWIRGFCPVSVLVTAAGVSEVGLSQIQIGATLIVEPQDGQHDDWFASITGDALAQVDGGQLTVSALNATSTNAIGFDVNLARGTNEFRMGFQPAFPDMALTAPSNASLTLTLNRCSDPMDGQHDDWFALQFRTEQGFLWGLTATHSNAPLPLARAEVWRNGTNVVTATNPASVQVSELPGVYWPSTTWFVEADICHRFPYGSAVTVQINGTTYAGDELRVLTAGSGRPATGFTGLRVETTGAEALMLSGLKTGPAQYKLEPPVLDGRDLIIRDNTLGGVIQSAPAITGPWTTVMPVDGEVRVSTTNAPARFFRVRGN